MLDVDECNIPLSDYSYNGVSISWNGNITSIDWSGDGTYLYGGAKNDRTAYTYTVPTPFIITGAATGEDERYGFISDGSIGSGDEVWSMLVTRNSSGIDGRAMFLAMQGSLNYAPLFQYDVDPAWKPWREPTYTDYTTFVGEYNLWNDTGTPGHHDMRMSPDGHTLIAMLATSPPKLGEWNLPNAFSITGITYTGSTSIPANMRFSCLYIPPSGKCVYFYNTATNSIEQYALGTAWDSSTLDTTLVSSLDTSSELTNSQAIYVGNGHAYAFTIQTGPTPGTLYQYDL